MWKKVGTRLESLPFLWSCGGLKKRDLTEKCFYCSTPSTNLCEKCLKFICLQHIGWRGSKGSLCFVCAQKSAGIIFGFFLYFVISSAFFANYFYLHYVELPFWAGIPVGLTIFFFVYQMLYPLYIKQKRLMEDERRKRNTQKKGKKPRRRALLAKKVMRKS